MKMEQRRIRTPDEAMADYRAWAKRRRKMWKRVRVKASISRYIAKGGIRK